MIDTATIEKLIEKAQVEKAKRKPSALDTILNNSKLNRLKTQPLSKSGLKGVGNCCNSCENKNNNSIDGQGPYLILSYKPDSDKWEAQSTKNPQEIFLGDLTFPGLIAPGFILPGWHTLGEPYGLIQPKRTGKPFEATDNTKKTNYITITINLDSGFTGRG